MSIQQLCKIMSMLRDPEFGCPWDLKQNFSSIAPHTVEEVYEVIDTIEREDFSHLPNELGDLLFQVVFFSQLGKEQGLFNFDDVVNEITTKLLTRHPHVFPKGTMESFGQKEEIDAEQVEKNWEKIKQSERGEKAVSESGELSTSVMDDIPLALPGILRAQKIQKRASNQGFDWKELSPVLDKLKEEIAELEEAIEEGDKHSIKDELGDVLFSVVNLSRHIKQNPEESLRFANKKFEKRFRIMEKTVLSKGLSLDAMELSELEHYWQRSKEIESNSR